MKTQQLIYGILIVWNMHSFAQTINKNSFLGNWYYCDSELGYEELYVKDTIFWNSWMGDLFYKYKMESNKVIYGENALNDTLALEYISSDSIRIEFKRNSCYEYSYFLTRIKDSIITYFDYNCTFRMNEWEFSTLVENGLNSRKEKHLGNCKDKTKTVEINLDFPDEAKKAFKRSGYLYLGLIDKIINPIDSILTAPKLVGMFYIKDTLKIVIETAAKCYSMHEGYIKPATDRTMNLIFEEMPGKCEGLCRYLLTYTMLIDKKRYDRFFFNGKELK